MDVFGLQPIQAIIVIAVVAVSLQVGLGYLQSDNPFDGRKLLTSAIIATVAALTVVGTAIADIDQLVKNTGSAIIAKLR